MRNIPTFIICVLLFAYQASAQEKINLGIFAGSVTNKFVGDRTSDVAEVRFQFGNAYQYGIMVDYGLKSDVYLAFTPSFKLSKGNLQEINPDYVLNSDQSFITTKNISLHYLSLPLELKLISDNQHWQFFTGLIYNQLLSAKGKNTRTNETSDLSQAIKNYNFSAMVGLGYRLHIFKQLITLDLRYTQGLINISEGEQQNTQNLPRLKTTSVESRLTWVLPIGKKDK
ncbi:PorT family protein [Reichenbachiella ulvae]|uniref:PorT family protein n=1 Tax=Reichenbachiella ulvae TaxID=2980104 RepID=A0ABT3CVE5_9BACT|nr:PorT family protein [Reichenbachiella ulvae]MCV9387544.1 PorT family protein [Reichenbachiella ulvae]